MAFEGVQLAGAQGLGNLGLEERIGAGGAAAQVPVGHRGEGVAQAAQDGLHRAAEFLGVLQGAGAVEGEGASVGREAGGEAFFQGLGAQHFHQILGQGADPGGLGGVGRVVFKQGGVFLDEGAAAAGGLDDGFGACRDGGPPGVDIAPGPIQAGGVGVQVVIDRAAAASLGGGDQADAEYIQHPGRGGVGVGRQAGLHAAFQYQHSARVTRCGAHAGWGAGLYLAGQGRGQQGAGKAGGAQGQTK